MLVQENKIQYEIDYASFKDRLRKGAIPPDARVASRILTDGEWRSVGDLRLYERIRRLGDTGDHLWLTHITEPATALEQRESAPVSRLAWLLVGWNYAVSIATAMVAFGGSSAVGSWAPWITVTWAGLGAAVAVILDQYRLGAAWARTALTILAMATMVLGGAAVWLAAMSGAWGSTQVLTLVAMALADILLGVRMLYRLVHVERPPADEGA